MDTGQGWEGLTEDQLWYGYATTDGGWDGFKGFYEAAGFDAERIPKQKTILCSTYLYNIIVGGVGAGKSIMAAMYALPRVMQPSTTPKAKLAHYWFCGENYYIPRMEFQYVLDGLNDLGVPLGKPSMPTEGPWSVEITGVAVIETKSWTNPDSLHSIPVQGMLICEAGLLDAWTWHNRLRNRLERVPNSWCLWSGTIEEAGTFYKSMVNDVVLEKQTSGWFGLSIASWENVFRYPGGYDDPDIQKLIAETPPDVFQERYAAVPKQVAALVYQEASFARHVGHYDFDKHRPVFLGIDPGGVYAVDVVQMLGDDVYLIDEIHGEGWTSEDVIREAVKKPWWSKVDFGVIDVTQTEARKYWLGDAEIWKAVEQEPVPIHPRKVAVEDGIELVRAKLHSGTFDRDKTPEEDIWQFQGKTGVSRLHIDSGCKYTVQELTEGYRRKRLSSGLYSPTQVVDRDNHHMAGLAYLLANLAGYVYRRPKARQKARWRDARPIAHP